MKNIKFVITIVFAISLLGCSTPNHEQPKRKGKTETMEETPIIPQDPSTPNYQKTMSNLPDNLYACGSFTVFPYLILDSKKLSEGSLVNAPGKMFDDHTYIFNFSTVPFIVSEENTPGLTTYIKATKKALASAEHAKSKGLIHEGYSYGFQDSTSKITLHLPIALDPLKERQLSEKWKNVFYAEYYFINFSVEAKVKTYTSFSDRVYVSDIYWGSYARIVVATNYKREKVFEAFNERLSNSRSKKWDEILQDQNYELYISLSHVPDSGKPVDSSQFFSVVVGDKPEPKPIFFTVK